MDDEFVPEMRLVFKESDKTSSTIDFSCQVKQNKTYKMEVE